MEHFTKYLSVAQETLNAFMENPQTYVSLEEAGSVLLGALKNGGKIISCGNGGSMCDAMHFAEELSGRYRDDRPAYAALSISDPSHISCVANDYGYDSVFSRMVEAIGNPGDVLFAISTSGNSANVLKAIQAAKSKGMKTVGLTGKDGGKMAALLDVEIRAPKTEYADHAQEIHIKVIHALIGYIENGMSEKP